MKIIVTKKIVIFIAHINTACLAQRSEHRTCNAMVIGSTPIAGFFLIIKSIKNKFPFVENEY